MWFEKEEREKIRIAQTNSTRPMAHSPFPQPKTSSPALPPFPSRGPSNPHSRHGPGSPSPHAAHSLLPAQSGPAARRSPRPAGPTRQRRSLSPAARTVRLTLSPSRARPTFSLKRRSSPPSARAPLSDRQPGPTCQHLPLPPLHRPRNASRDPGRGSRRHSLGMPAPRSPAPIFKCTRTLSASVPSHLRRPEP